MLQWHYTWYADFSIASRVIENIENNQGKVLEKLFHDDELPQTIQKYSQTDNVTALTTAMAVRLKGKMVVHVRWLSVRLERKYRLVTTDLDSEQISFKLTIDGYAA